MISAVSLFLVIAGALSLPQYPTPFPFAYPGQYPAQYPAFPQYPSYVKAIPAPVPVPVAKPLIPIQVAPKYATDESSAAVARQYQDVGYDGSFSYGFESTNGIQSKSEGYVKDAGSPEPKQVITGSYSYTGKDNVPVSITYVADENGYRADGDAIPKPHPEILKALAAQGLA